MPIRQKPYQVWRRLLYLPSFFIVGHNRPRSASVRLASDVSDTACELPAGACSLNPSHTHSVSNSTGCRISVSDLYHSQSYRGVRSDWNKTKTTSPRASIRSSTGTGCPSPSSGSALNAENCATVVPVTVIGEVPSQNEGITVDTHGIAERLTPAVRDEMARAFEGS